MIYGSGKIFMVRIRSACVKQQNNYQIIVNFLAYAFEAELEAYI